MLCRLIDRHNANINICFLDGSVRKVGLKYLWDLKWHRQYKLRQKLLNGNAWPAWMANMRGPVK